MAQDPKLLWRAFNHVGIAETRESPSRIIRTDVEAVALLKASEYDSLNLLISPVQLSALVTPRGSHEFSRELERVPCA